MFKERFSAWLIVNNIKSSSVVAYNYGFELSIIYGFISQYRLNPGIIFEKISNFNEEFKIMSYIDDRTDIIELINHINKKIKNFDNKTFWSFMRGYYINIYNSIIAENFLKRTIIKILDTHDLYLKLINIRLIEQPQIIQSIKLQFNLYSDELNITTNNYHNKIDSINNRTYNYILIIDYEHINIIDPIDIFFRLLYHKIYSADSINEDELTNEDNIEPLRYYYNTYIGRRITSFSF